MANPTTNYGWPMPTSTDLVTDLPADFVAFGQPVDTSLKALNPETTLGDIAYRSATSNTNTRLGIGTNGQVLAVSGGVPAWTTTADVTPLTTKGDLFTFSTVDARLGVGSNDQILVADSAEATGLKWATPASGVTFAGVSVYNAASITLTNGVITTITFDTETFDTNTYHSTVTNTSRLTVPTGKAGYYLLAASAGFGASTTGIRALYFRRNGTEYVRTANTGDWTVAVNTQNTVLNFAIVYLAEADYIELHAIQTSGGNLAIYVQSTGTYPTGAFQMTLLGA